MLRKNEKGVLDTYLVIALVVMIAIGGFVFWRISTAEEATPNNSTIISQDPTAGTVATQEEITDENTESSSTADWQLFTSEFSGYTISYPNTTSDCSGETWVSSENPSNQEIFDEAAFFGPPCSRSGGYIWGVSVFPTTELEDKITLSGDQFEDRMETREDIVVDGVSGILVTVTTQEIPDWVSKHVILSKDGDSYSIENGAADSEDFETFYNSFKFVD